jgi:hypothetical protein
LTRTAVYEATTTGEEDWRRRCGRNDDVEDGAEPEGEGTEASALDDATVDIRWPFSPSRIRSRPACYSVGFLRR